jgi:hypothetical protein
MGRAMAESGRESQQSAPIGARPDMVNAALTMLVGITETAEA